MIQLSSIEHEHRLNCPYCDTPRLLVKPMSVEVPGGGVWLSDGDTIGGLYAQLVEAGLEKALDLDDPGVWHTVHYDYMLSVGECPTCDGEYYVIEVKMIDDAASVDEIFVESYFRNNIPIPPATNFVATLPRRDLKWIAIRHDTPNGVCIEHVFGLFALNGMSMKGPYGVAGCSSGDPKIWDAARQFVFSLWPHFKVLARNIQPQT